MEGFRGFRNVPYMSRVTSRALLCLPHESLAASCIEAHTHTGTTSIDNVTQKRSCDLCISQRLPNAAAKTPCITPHQTSRYQRVRHV